MFLLASCDFVARNLKRLAIKFNELKSLIVCHAHFINANRIEFFTDAVKLGVIFFVGHC